ncbi:26S proteasome non-ATPase regulatory subunit 13 [Tetranychus urticae]|uniref:26S proteasome non-ATPase regulatory subunit 13 n=1 Tax=Tetranychus urticae TaxID=32264 RepID=T1KRS1_TETUR|nr:26S proteasome non-ATPase regulatory subunit 13 [Tetranychus urticae]
MGVNEYLKSMESRYPEFTEYWTAFEGYYNKKLWHQLTMKTEAFVKLPESNRVDLVAFYTNFIAEFETKLNPLSLVEIIAFIIKEMKDYQECLVFLEKIKEKVKGNQTASLLCSILMAQLKLANKELDDVKKILGEIGPIIDEQTGITPIHGRYFQLSSDYNQIIGNHVEYYRNALRFLGCSSIDNESDEHLENRAFALALAALLGESIFNFGELLQHPIVEYLKRKHNWLLDLLYAFNAGDLERFEKLKPQWSEQADLRAHELQLRQKISLLCLMNMTFNSHDGILTFNEIAKKTYLPEGEVELLVMKALSLELVKGTIDEVEKKVYLSWVQPRVLDKTQINSLKSKLEHWSKDVRKMEILLEQKVQEIIG